MAVTALGMLSCVFASAQANEISQNEISQNSQNQMMNPSTQANCNALSPAEQDFAKRLSADNQKMFCGRFSADQRKTAMQMAGQTDANGNIMNPDQAVQKVAGPRYGNSPSNGGGCPVRQ